MNLIRSGESIEIDSPTESIQIVIPSSTIQ